MHAMIPYLTQPLVILGTISFVILLVFRLLTRAPAAAPARAARVPGAAATRLRPRERERPEDKAIKILRRYGLVVSLAVILLGVILVPGKHELPIVVAPLPPVDASAIVVSWVRSSRELDRLDAQRQTELTDWKQAALETVSALAELRRRKEVSPPPEQALAALAQGQTTEARVVLQSLAARVAKDPRQAATAQRHLGTLLFVDDAQAALDALQRATELAPDDAAGWILLGHLLLRAARLDEAELAYRKMLDLATATGAQALAASAVTDLGNVEYARGELERAEALYRHALELDQALGRKEDVARGYANIGDIYDIRGELEQAERLYRQALTINQELGRKVGMASDYGNLGHVFYVGGNLEQAEAMFRQSLELYRALEHRDAMASDYTNLGNVYYHRGDRENAEAMFRQALEIYRTL